MAYTAWSVVYGEQPTAAKWNQLGENDAGFRDGSNMAWTNAINAGAASHIDLRPAANKLVKVAVLRQDDTTNSYLNKSIILTGWGRMAYNAGSPNITDAVTFGLTFDQRPIVVATFGGDHPSATTYGSGANLVEGIVVSKAHTILTTGFTMHLHKGNGTNFVAGNGFYQWIAIGEYSG